MANKKLVSVSPHISTNLTTRRVMLDVIIALIPALLFGTYFFGFYPLLMTILTITTCVASEWAYNKIRKQDCTINDCSAIVTGLILGLNLPPYVPFYIPIFGGIFAIVVVKMLFGGLGRNFANPAATARVFLLLSWSGVMTKFANPIAYGAGESFFTFPVVDAVASATPLQSGNVSILNAFIGNIGGSFGETSALALLIGGLYLIIRGHIDFRIPFIVIFGSIGFSVLFGLNGYEAITSTLYGGMFIGAFFMATDYATSPNTRPMRMVYALIIALWTTLIRIFGAYPEGMSFAIVLGNILVPLFDRLYVPTSFGDGKDKTKIIVNVAIYLFIAVTFVIAIIQFGGAL